jgi:hypothetical protein
VEPGSVIEIDGDSDGDGNDNGLPIIVIQPPSAISASGSTTNRALDTDTSAATPQLKNAINSTKNIPKAGDTTIPAENVTSHPVRLYVIPAFMDKLVYSLSRERALQLSWEWLGPLEKTLSTDPRGNHDAPPLDQEKTTHIVTALSDMDRVKKFLHVETIDVSWFT